MEKRISGRGGASEDASVFGIRPPWWPSWGVDHKTGSRRAWLWRDRPGAMVIPVLSEPRSLMSDLGHRTDSPWERTQPGMATSAPGHSLRVAPGRHIDARLLSGGARVLGWGASSLGLPLTREGHSLRPQFFYLYGEELVLSKERNAATRMSGIGGPRRQAGDLSLLQRVQNAEQLPVIPLSSNFTLGHGARGLPGGRRLGE